LDGRERGEECIGEIELGGITSDDDDCNSAWSRRKREGGSPVRKKCNSKGEEWVSPKKTSAGTSWRGKTL